MAGLAYLVKWKYRPGSTYVTTQKGYVLKDIDKMLNLNMLIEISTINYFGKDALSILTTVQELYSELPSTTQLKMEVVGNVLRTRKRV